MPDPFEVLIDPISLIILAMYAGLMLYEAVRPGRALPKQRWWRLQGVIVFLAFFYLSTYLPLVWAEQLVAYQLVDLSSLGTGLGTIVGLLLYELGAWAWHRALHAFGPLWRIHQTHHSAERLDVASAFLFHPFDMVGWIALSSLCLVLLVGVTPQATTYVVLITTWLTIFQHTNIKTPRWLGYIIQRPESHALHHAQGIHRFNYSDLPLFDMLLATFKNPTGYEYPTGLYPGGSARVRDLLLLREVAAPIPERMPDGVSGAAFPEGIGEG